MNRFFFRTPVTALIAAVSFLTAPTLPAANFAGAPALAQDPGADIGDLYAFIDPNDGSKVILIGTFHEFIVPGTAPDLAVFDPNIRYRFEIYNDHVNLASPVMDSSAKPAQKAAFLARIKPNRTIDVTFTKREVGVNPQSNAATGIPVPPNLRRPVQQLATVTLTGFTGVRNKGIYPGVAVSPFGVTATASPLQVYEISNVTAADSIRIFAGEVDDPFFFDSPAFSAYLDSIRNGSPNPSVFGRARDTFAGYNTLAIALRVPLDLLKGSNGNMLGIDLLTQRHVTEMATTDGPKGVGAYKTVDRSGNPAISSLFVPFDLRNAYNAATPKDDASLKFAGAIEVTLSELGLASIDINYAVLTNLMIAKGDLLQLDTSVANNSVNPEAAFPNGRRVTDDVMNTLLTVINQGTSLGDGVNANDFSIPATFPFLALPHQPLFNASVDDSTRN